MNKADEALVEVRRWLCDSLSDGDAGKVCGMLSVVSRRIVEIEDENAKLRELVRDALRPKYDHTLRMPPAKWREYDADVLRRACELGIEVDDG